MGLRLYEVLELISGPVICVEDGKRAGYGSGREAREKSGRDRPVTSITAEDGMVVIAVKADKTRKNDLDEAWAREHRARFGTGPSIFDGA